jgi:release factor glutamine methyltransferase
MAWALGTDRGRVLAASSDPLPAGARPRFERFVEGRCRRVPEQYLTGGQEFRGRVFRVDPRVLVPRPETEEVVATALAFVPLDRESSVVDFGTGSGCIAISIALERPLARVLALDSSEGALEVARENGERLGASRVEFVRGDLASPPAEWIGRIDLVISNPPYVSEEEWRTLAPEVRDHEPKAALVPGPTGDEAYAALAPAAFRLLVPGGALVLELGHRNAPFAYAAVEAAGFRAIEIRPDVRGIPRILAARR